MVKKKFKRGDLVTINGKLAGMVLSLHEEEYPQSPICDYRVLIDGRGAADIKLNGHSGNELEGFYFLLIVSESLAVIEVDEEAMTLRFPKTGSEKEPNWENYQDIDVFREFVTLKVDNHETKI